MKNLNASEAIYGFCAWLSTRKKVTKFGSKEDCAPTVALIAEFCEVNNLKDPRDKWAKNLTHPKS